MWWTDSSGRIELEMTLTQARSCAHSGQCLGDVQALRSHPKLIRQLRKLNPSQVAEYLRETGAWDDEELQDHDLNLSRLVWLAANDIAEENP